ncbi:MAG TPA: hypothetical protein VHY20_07765, partial [Pirellulales bacterium]|nr:hypothetical protein [Pirellulales bacterium]
MLEQRLEAQIARVARRLRWLAVQRTLCWVWVAALLIAAGLWLAGPATAAIDVPTSLAICGVLLAISLLALGYQLVGGVNEVAAAREIERCYPELNARLLAAVSQRRDVAWPRLGYLQATVISETLAHRNRTGWSRVAPRSRLVAAGVLQGLLLAGFGILLGLATRDSLASSELGPEQSFSANAERYTAAIEPGDVEIERGTSLLVLARFERELPAEVQLAFETATAKPEKRAMSKSLADPVYAARLADIRGDLTYAVEFAGVRSPSYRVTVFDYPELERADVQLTFPEYTSQPATLVEDSRQVTAVEGTKLKLIARLNKDVATARLVHDNSPAIELKPTPGEPHVYSATWPLTATARYRLELVDPQGRKNKQPPEFTFTAVPNRKPDIKLVFPARDVQVSPLEEIELAASIWDDFSLLAYGIAYSLDGQPPQETVLGQQTAARQKLDARQLISLEALEAQSDQLLSYYFFADDVGPDGQRRRTLSDMFFCEVRPFDEIYRQGEPSSGKSASESAS